MNNDLIEIQNHPQLEPLKDEKPDNEELVQDLSLAREKQLNLIDTGEQSLGTLVQVATQLQHPRAYEVLATFIKTLSELNKDLINISERKSFLKNEEKEEKEVAPVATQVNFFGSTADMARMLKNISSKKDEELKVIDGD
jgi:hypothetical protein